MANNEKAVSYTNCNHSKTVEDAQLTFVGLVNGEKVTYKASGIRCAKCGLTWSEGQHEEEHDQRKADAYRIGRELLTSEDMEQARAKLGMTKGDFCDFITVPRVTYDRWLKGLIQNVSMDAAVRAKVDPATAAENNLQLIWLENSSQDKRFRGKEQTKLGDLFKLICWFVQNKGKRALGKLYLNKLCWFADQLLFNVHSQTITGAQYVSYKHGPVFENYEQVFRVLLQNKYLVLSELPNDFILGERSASLPALSDLEARTAAFVWSQYSSRLEKLRDDSHLEDGWKKTPALEKIDFTLTKRLKRIDQGKFEEQLKTDLAAKRVNRQ